MTNEGQVYATAPELRAIADLIDKMNQTAGGLVDGGSVIYVDNISVTDPSGNVLGVLEWRTESDSFGVALR